MNKLLLNSGIINCLLSVALGAFAAHSLQNLIDVKGISTFQIGVRYQFYHGLALLFCALYYKIEAKSFIKTSGILFLIGILLFSGSLYALAFNKLVDLPTQLIGPLTPIGGVLFIAGWITLLFGNIKNKTYE